MFKRNLTLILITLLLGGFFFVNADDPATNYQKADLAYAASVLNSKERELLEQWKELDKLEIQQAMLRVQWDDNAEDMAENAIDLADAVTVDFLQIVAAVSKSTANSIKDMNDAVALASSRVTKNSEISYQNIYIQQKINARDSAYTHYKKHYDAYVKAYSPSDLELIEKGGTPSLLGVDSGLSVPCANMDCSTTYSVDEYSLDTVVWVAYNKHKVTCPREHGNSQMDLPTPPPYWDCPDDPGKCPKFGFHKTPCRGGCGTTFAKGDGDRSKYDHAHYKGVCEGYDIPESYVNTFGSSSKYVDCPGRFYNCNGQISSTHCPFKTVHVKKGSQKSASLSGSSSASAGSSVSVSLSTATAFSQVYWYVAGPGDSGLGTNVETDSGGSSSTSASLSYSFPSSASGDYVITAYIYNYSDSSIYTSSHTVSVSGSSSTAPSDATPNCQDCTSHCSSPCSCSNSGTCNGSVSAPSPPSTPPSGTQVTCSDCNASYDSTDPDSYQNHQTVSCAYCGASFKGCQNNASACFASDSGWHSTSLY